MNPNDKITELLQVLADRGLSDEAIVNVRDGLWGQANEAFMSDMLSALTDEDLQRVEASGTQDEANASLRNIYEEKTGKNMQEEMQKIVDQYASDLIKKYKIEDAIPDAPVNTDSGSTDSSPSEGNFFDSASGKKEEDTIHDLT